MMEQQLSDDLDSATFKQFLESIRSNYGYDFTNYAEASMKRRIHHFMNGHKIFGIDRLGKVLLEDETLFEEFVHNVSITVTEMFRDPSFYRSLRENVMKQLATYPVIKIWIAGCATGEEVYSLAIMLKEENLLPRAIIYATDINQKSLEIAREGVYPVTNMKAYTTNYIKAGGKNSFSSYYKAKYDAILFEPSLKQNVVFAPHNLATDKSFNEFQLITCRNVLIYFNETLQNQVINLFYESLCPFGFFGMGSKESLLFSSKAKCFEDVDRKEKIFRKIR